MADVQLVRDSLFQLNVLIWACFPQAPGAPVTPVLREAGYELWSVEQPLNADIAELARLRNSEPQVQPNPVADGVLRRQGKGDYVLVECKASSFGSASQQAARQARGLVVAGGNVAPRLGVAGTASAEVCYLVPATDVEPMDETLIELVAEVSGQNFRHCPTGPVGVSIKGDGAYLGLSSTPRGTSQMPRELIPERRVVAVSPGQDPRPLYVVPWIPDAPDDADMAAFKEKIRVQVLAWLGKAPIDGEVILSFGDVLDEVSRGIFRHWSDRHSLLGRVFPAVGGLVHLLFGGDGRVNVGRREARVRLGTEKDRDELMEQVRTAALPPRLPQGVQPPLPLEEEA
jgi:hypothetical protein